MWKAGIRILIWLRYWLADMTVTVIVQIRKIYGAKVLEYSTAVHVHSNYSCIVLLPVARLYMFKKAQNK